MFKKKEEYTGPVDQYGRPIDTPLVSDRAEDDRKLGIIFFTILGIATIIVLVILFVINYMNQNRLEIPTATLSTTEWTKEAVTVTVDKSRGNIQDFSFDGGKTWQQTNQFVVEENQELHIRVRNQKGKVSKEATVIVSNIDQTLPELHFIEPLYIVSGEKFDPKVNVVAFDSDSGLLDYEVDTSQLDLMTSGEYNIHYFVSDHVGNEVSKTRKIIVEAPGMLHFYRSRTVQVIETQCETACKCVRLEGDFCPPQTTLSSENLNQCCEVCLEPCLKPQYGEWSEWKEEKIIPSAELEVEMKSEVPGSDLTSTLESTPSVES